MLVELSKLSGEYQVIRNPIDISDSSQKLVFIVFVFVLCSEPWHYVLSLGTIDRQFDTHLVSDYR